MAKLKFKTTVLQSGNNTGLVVPENILEELGGGKRPLVVVSVNDYVYRSAIAKMGDKFLISLSAENRANAKVKGGDEVNLTLELDTAPREVELPSEFAAALNKNKTAKSAFDKLAPSKKKAIVVSINDAKTEETKTRRIEKAIESLS